MIDSSEQAITPIGSLVACNKTVAGASSPEPGDAATLMSDGLALMTPEPAEPTSPGVEGRRVRSRVRGQFQLQAVGQVLPANFCQGV